MADYSQLANEFNQTLRRLIRIITAGVNSDPDIARVKTRVSLAIDYSPLDVVDCVGYYLLGFSEQITRLVTPDGELTDDPEAESFFFDNSFEAELAAGENPEHVSIVRLLIPRIQTCAQTLDVREKTVVVNLVVELHDTYILYLQALRRR